MCLAIPARIEALLPGQMARVSLGGVIQSISLALVDGAGVGDYVIVHVGFALQRLDEEEALETLALISEGLRAATDPDEEAGKA